LWWREEGKAWGAVALQGIEEDGGRREEGDERAQEMGGRRWFVRVGNVGGRRWKQALTGGPHLPVSQRERVQERGRGGGGSSWGEVGPGSACWAALGRKKERGREERERERRKREGRWAGLQRERKRVFFLKTGCYKSIPLKENLMLEIPKD
jgi:hypothetical protein